MLSDGQGRDGYFPRGRAGRFRGRDFNPGDFPFDAFEFEDYDKVANPILKMKSPWVLQTNKIEENTIQTNIYITNSYYDGTVQVGEDLQSEGYEAGVSGWITKGDGNAELNEVTIRGTVYASAGEFTGKITAASGEIGGFRITATTLEHTAGDIGMSSLTKRFEIKSVGTVKIALGYLDGVSDYTGTQYGLYIAPGNEVRFEGGGQFVDNDYTIQEDGAVLIVGPDDTEEVRLGSLYGGDIGIDIGGMKFIGTLGGGDANDTYDDTLGGGNASSSYTSTLGGGNAYYGARGFLYSINEGFKLYGDALIDGTVTADKIDVDDLFAQDITFTNTIQSDGFVSGSGGKGVKLDATNDAYEFHGTIYADDGIFSGELNAVTGSFGTFGEDTGIEIKDGAITFTDSSIFGGTSKGSLQQGSLGNIGLIGQTAVVLKTSNEHSVQVNAFAKFIPSEGLYLGDSGTPWGKGYVEQMYIQDELRLGSETWSAMPALQGFSFFALWDNENDVFDALKSIIPLVGDQKSCIGYCGSNAVGYIERYASTVIRTMSPAGVMLDSYTDGGTSSILDLAIALVV